MTFELTKTQYTGKVREVIIGEGDNTIKVGGETSYPFYLFEGEMPNPPKVAMEIWDMEPEEWPEAVLEPFKDVLKDPVAWAKKCVDEYGADMIVVQLKSIDPNGLNKGPKEASATVKKVCEAVNVPVVVWGCANKEKDIDVLKKIAEDNQGKNLLLGPVEEASYKQIGASALGFQQSVIASSPIDINLAKQLNVLLDNLGVSSDKIIIDPTTGGLGYGLEYSYSIMERIRMAALTQEDEKLQIPIMNNLGNEIWKCKEVKLSLEEDPTLGDPAKRGIMMESVGAVSYLMAGSDILVMRHPESVKLIREFIGLLITGDLAVSPDKLAAKLSGINVKPEGDYPKIEKIEVKIEPKEEKKKAAPKAPPKVAAKPEVKEEKKVVEVPKAAKEEKAKDKDKAEEVVKAKAEEEAKAEAEAKAKAEAEVKAKAEAEAEAKAKAEAEAKAKAGAEAKAKAEEVAKREAEEEKIREQREKEKEKLLVKRAGKPTKKVSMTAAAVQKTELEKILEKLNRIHGRNID